MLQQQAKYRTRAVSQPCHASAHPVTVAHPFNMTFNMTMAGRTPDDSGAHEQVHGTAVGTSTALAG